MGTPRSCEIDNWQAGFARVTCITPGGAIENRPWRIRVSGDTDIASTLPQIDSIVRVLPPPKVHMVSRSPPTAKLSGLILGFSLGASLDGIVLHQIAQWHSMASAVVPPTTLEAMRRNMAWDGMFHAACWILIVVGVLPIVWRR